MSSFKNFFLSAAILFLILGGLLIGCGDDDDNDDQSHANDDAADDDLADDDAVDDDIADDDATDDDTTPDDDTVDDDATPDDDTIDDDTTPDDDTADDDATPDDDTTPEELAVEPGIYDVTGTDSVLGAYSGVVEVRPTADDPNFIRLVQYTDLTFPDPRLDLEYDVYSAWTGTFPEGESPAIAVVLKVADFINQYDGLTRTEDDGTPVEITGSIATGGAKAIEVTYHTPPEALHYLSATETWTYSAPNGTEPLFIYQDTQVQSHEALPSWAHDLLFLILGPYHDLEFFDPYRDREDFNAAIHFVGQFRTDFDWYRAHPNAVRVVNKWVDEISMAESMLRARGFAPTLGDKAANFDAEMPVYYLNSLGMFSMALYNSMPLQQSESGDGLLWSGCYLGSQVFRYLTTGEPEALANWLRELDGLMLSHDIVQDPTNFARSVRPHLDDGNPNWIQGAAPYEAYDWLCCGNNDMIQGLYYGYTLSYIFLPDEPAYDDYRTAIAERAARLADSGQVANDGGFNEIKAHWLAYLTTGEQSYYDHFQELWSNPLLRLWAGGGDGQFYIWGITDWSGQHLDTIGHLILWFLADATADPSISVINDGWINGMRANQLTQTLWPIAAAAFVDILPGVQDVFDNAVWNMREIPYPKQALSIDKRIDPAWCPSPFPSLPWKFDWMQGGRNQGLYGVPIFGRNMHSCLWVTGPFDYNQNVSDWTDGAGADYLHAYWLGRYYGVFTPED